MKYTGGELDMEGVYFGDLTTNLQPILEKMATDTLQIMIRDNPPMLEYDLNGDTAKIGIAFDAFSVGDFITFNEDLRTAIDYVIDMHKLHVAKDGGWLDDTGRKQVTKIREDLQKNLDYVDMWLAKEPK